MNSNPVAVLLLLVGSGIHDQKSETTTLTALNWLNAGAFYG